VLSTQQAIHWSVAVGERELRYEFPEKFPPPCTKTFVMTMPHHWWNLVAGGLRPKGARINRGCRTTIAAPAPQ
jgi:hypothetical protein